MHPLIKKATIALILLSFLPLLSGLLIKRQYHRLLTTITDLSQVEIQTKEYHRGWFHSSAISEITFPQNENQAPLIFRIEHFIDHGPFFNQGPFLLAEIHSQLVPIESPATPSSEVAEMPLIFKTTLGLTGHVMVELDVAQ